MGNKLFGVDIAKLVNQNIGSGILDATFTRVVAGTRTAGNLTGGTKPTETDFACKGFIGEQDKEKLGGTLVDAGDIVIVLVGDSIDSGNTAPTVKDKVTIEGTTYRVRALERDPAKALYNLLCSKD